jgi:hypothetical protein
MSRLKTNLVVSATFVVIAIVGTIISVQYAAAQPPGPPDGLAVRIVSPLPVPVSGTTTIGGIAPGTTILTRNLDEPGRAPFSLSLHCETETGNACIASSSSIPLGKRFVVEYASGEIQVRGISNRPYSTTLDTPSRGFVAFLHAQFDNDDGVLSNLSINQPLLIYVEPGEEIRVGFTGQKIGMNGTIVLTGHLVDVSV